MRFAGRLRANSRVSQHTVYVAIGVNLEDRKELLGLWLAESESAKFWLSVLTDMKNRGLDDIFIACIDGLAGFAEAIHTAYENTKVQLCVVHLERAALRYVVDKDSNPRFQIGDQVRPKGDAVALSILLVFRIENQMGWIGVEFQPTDQQGRQFVLAQSGQGHRLVDESALRPVQRLIGMQAIIAMYV